MSKIFLRFLEGMEQTNESVASKFLINPQSTSHFCQQLSYRMRFNIQFGQ